jgi:serine/threonine protein kinase
MDDKEFFGYQLGPNEKRILLGSGMDGDTFLGWVRMKQPQVEYLHGKPDYIQRPAALKRFSRLQDDQDGSTNWLTRQVLIHRCLDHPNIVKFLVQFYDGHVPVLATEYIEGSTLQQLVTARYEGNPAQLQSKEWHADLLDWIIQLSWCLDYLSDAKILHRDIKPANIIIEEATSKAVLIDFGVGRSFHANRQPSLTTSPGAGFIGTYAFGSPEQFDAVGYPPTYATNENGEATPTESRLSLASDIYSLAATLIYAMVPDFVEEVERMKREAPTMPDLSIYLRQVPEYGEFRSFLKRMIAMDPKDRPTPAQCAAAFTHVLTTIFKKPSRTAPVAEVGKKMSDDELPKFLSLGDGKEIATQMLSHYAYCFWNGKEEARIYLTEANLAARLTYPETLDLIEKINSNQGRESPYTYRLPTIEEWCAGAGFPALHRSTSTSRRSRQLMMDYGSPEEEWCHDSERSKVDPNCRIVCFAGYSGPQYTDRHMRWPKGTVRLVRELNGGGRATAANTSLSASPRTKSSQPA